MIETSGSSSLTNLWVNLNEQILVHEEGSLEQRDVADVKHSSLPEQSVNVYKGSSLPGVLHQLSTRPDVKDKLWTVSTSGFKPTSSLRHSLF